MNSRRLFLKRGTMAGVASLTTNLWNRSAGLSAFAQMPSSDYKAIVLVSLNGGNDANNMLIPLDSARYGEYSKLRQGLAIPSAQCIPLQNTAGEPSYGLHPAMPKLAQLYNSQGALFAVNVGPIIKAAKKQELLANPGLLPSLFSHATGVSEWESAISTANPATGWGGRLADLIADKSGNLPPVFDAGLPSLFTVGNNVQAVAVQAGQAFAALPPELNRTVLRIAQADTSSANLLTAQLAKVRVAALQQQTLIDQASAYGNIKSQFPNSAFGNALQKIAQVMAGRSIVGASRQIFYTKQGFYDTHQSQLQPQADNLADLDAGLAAFSAALNELGLTNDVLVCTHSDFNRTFTSNTNGGSDHGWGTHQIVLGGGIKGGRILGTFPTLEIGGPDDINTTGAWIPTTSVSQFTGGIGSWMGLSQPQLTSVFPELSKFVGGPMIFS